MLVAAVVLEPALVQGAGEVPVELVLMVTLAIQALRVPELQPVVAEALVLLVLMVLLVILVRLEKLAHLVLPG
jgi:hypothetical protein